MCQLPQKSHILKRKSQTIFWRQLSLKKSNLLNLRQKSQSGNPGEPRQLALFLSFADLWVAIKILALLKYKSRLEKTRGFGWRGRLGFACADRLGPEKLLISLHWFGILRWLGLTHLWELCTWFTAGCHCCVAKLWDCYYVLTAVVVTLECFCRSNFRPDYSQ